jgi:hypothetical protein
MAKQQFICLHIAKTAGGTLKRALINSPDLNVEFMYGAKDREALAAKPLDDVDLVYGHTKFGIHEQLGFEQAPRYFCFMRHPVSRTISHYYHLRNVDKSAVGDKIRGSADINDFFDGLKHWEFSNFMARVVSGVGIANTVDDAEILERAKRNLDTHFDFVGFQEFFSFSGLKLGKIIGTNLTFEKDVNVGRYDLSSISEETLDKITSANDIDFELYKYAINKFL